MNVTDALGSIINSPLNRYSLDVPSCLSSLDVEDFSGREGMSQTYHYDILFTSANRDLAAEQFLRKSASLTMGCGLLQSLTDKKVVHGVITGFRRISGSADEVKYLITLEPFLSLLANQFRTHRFFINKSVPDVVEQVLTEHGLKGWEYNFSLKSDYPKREQINQYQENDLAFIERLLAEVGIFYFFTLQADTQTEVVQFGDEQSAWQFDKALPLNSPSGASDSGADSVWNLHVRHHVAESSVTASDYNHRDANKVLVSAPADMSHGEAEGTTYGEVYHYRARHLESGDKFEPAAESGNFWARIEHERYLSSRTTVIGSSTDATLSPAQVLTIVDDNIPSTLPGVVENGLVIISAAFTASRKNALRVEWSAMPYSETRCWRPPARKRPVISGTLTARVTSARDNDEYAHLNQNGLYWVKFDADRDEKQQGYESMPVRLAKPYGGETYGMHFPLIQGTEVAIAFHEGDPDRPYIAYALHDSRHPDHVTSDNNTRNVLRTAGLNKLRMEDKRGEEHIKLSTEYGGKTQLNLGHNVDASRTLRGEGAELRTDKYVAIRGGAGVFITADKQPMAGDRMLSMREAIAQLEDALSIARSLSDAAETVLALPADIQSQVRLNNALKDLAQSGMVLNAPEGVSITSPQAVRVASGSASVGIMSRQNTDISALKRFTVAAGEAVSMLARKSGMKMFAAKGKVEIQAQDDALEAIAKKDVTVTSTEGRVEITAAKEVVLKNLDGSFIQLQGKNIILGCEGNILLKCANAQQMGPTTISSPPLEFPEGYGGIYALRDDGGNIIPKTEYKITTAEGKVFTGTSDENGKTSPIYTSMPGKLVIEILGTGNFSAGSNEL